MILELFLFAENKCAKQLEMHNASAQPDRLLDEIRFFYICCIGQQNVYVSFPYFHI